MYEWSKMSVGILGAGIENIALAKYLLKNGAKVIIYDKNDPGLISERLKELENSNLMVVAGKDYRRKLSVHDLFFRSPGMPLDLAKKITHNKGKLTSAMQLFFELCPGKIIGVTGTKGKGTTSAIIFEILKQGAKGLKSNVKKNVFLLGNIGKAPFDVFEEISSDDWVVMEMSSFQLEDMNISPHISVVLNITPDHLAPLNKSNPNYHKNFTAYVNSKRKIVEYQTEEDFAVLNLDDVLFEEFQEIAKSKFFRVGNLTDGCFIENDKFVVNINGISSIKASVSDFKIKGSHHLINAQAAIMASVLTKASDQEIVDGLRSFAGLPHRLQFVGIKAGVEYYDDSYATDPDASMAAIRAFEKPVILICGGSSKGAKFHNWAKAVKESSVKSVIAIGLEAEKMVNALTAADFKGEITTGLDKMSVIVDEAAKRALDGEVVLLSPACASFDMFKNAADRGDQFVKTIDGMASE